MSDYRAVLKKVGLALVLIGLADIGLMVYCIYAGQLYSSSLNIFAVIAGIFLLRGHLGAARLVTWFSAFLLAGIVGIVLLVLPFAQPAGLWAAEFRISPIQTTIYFVMSLILLSLIFWVYRQLRSSSVVAALEDDGRPSRTPKLAFVLGSALVIVVAILFQLYLNGSSGTKAVQLAKAKFGDAYQYHPTAIQWSGGHTSATLSAYNDHELKTVSVEWQD